MNYGNPPPYSDPSPTAPYPPYVQQPPGSYPAGPPGPYAAPSAGYPYHGYPQYGSPGATRVYLVEERERTNTAQSNCLAACWAALCCCCLMDALDD